MVSIFRKLGVSERLTTLVDAESLFNDGAAAVLFAVVLAVVVEGRAFSPGWAVGTFLWMSVGGTAVGLAVGFGASWIHRRLDDHLIEITLSTIVAYGSFLLAQALARGGLLARQGQIIDATFVEVPRQRNSRQENATIKDGQMPAEWLAQPAKARQKDVDARWAKKGEERHYGYKNHVKVDRASKLIETFAVTDAAVHDSDALETLLAPGDATTYVDSAYAGPRCEAVFQRHGIEARVIERPYRNRPLTKAQRRRNRVKSRVRVRVEHVFGTMTMSLRATWNRCIGKVRNQGAIAMMNLVYNLVRFEQIQRLQLRTW